MAEHRRDARRDPRGDSGVAARAALADLAGARRVAFAAADELLGHAPDTGDLAASRHLDAWVDQAADTLRALSEALEESLIDLGASLTRSDAAHRPSSSDRGQVGHGRA